MHAKRTAWNVSELVDGTTVAKRHTLKSVPMPLDLESIEEQFECDYILDTHGTIVLFRNRKF